MPDSTAELMGRASSLLAVALVGVVLLVKTAAAQQLPFSLFERYLEPLRQQAGIPGLSAVIVQDGHILWERVFGLRDVEASLPVLPDTPFHVGDLSQTFAALLIMQCVERGELSLDDPIARWVPAAANNRATIAQLLSHTSDPAPGLYRYDPARFALLTAVVQWCEDNQPYRKVLADALLVRLAMIDAVPGRDIGQTPLELRQLFDEALLERYAASLQRAAVPYRTDRRGRSVRSDLPPGGLDAAGGLLASARDLVRFDEAIDTALLLRRPTQASMWTNVSANGLPQPTGLGWFVQTYEGQRLVWHFSSMPDAYSALLLKVPERRLTLILLANSDGLSAPFSLGDGDVTSSLFARTFLRIFL